MYSTKRQQTPSPAEYTSSIGSVPPSIPSFQERNARPIFSTPVPHTRTSRYSSSPAVHDVPGVSRNTSRTTSRLSIYSPQLPVHLQRQRLSLRPPSSRASSTEIPGPEEHEELEAFPDDPDALGEVIMAFDMKGNGNVGCAYYIAADEALFLLEDVTMGGTEIVETILLHARPTTILIPARTSEDLADILSKGAQGVDRDDRHSEVQGAYILRTLKSMDFGYDRAIMKLFDLEIATQGNQTMLYTSVVDEGGDPLDDHGAQGGSVQGHLMRLGTSINLDSRLTIGCAGAVLGDIQRRKTAQYLPNDPDALVPFRIRSVQMFTLFDSMFINADTLASLQIIRSEFHPNSQMRGPDESSSGAKESLSVYGLFHQHACTPQGKSKLRQIFLRPSIDIALIESRQKTIGLLLRPEHEANVVSLTKDLRKIKNMRTSLSHLRQGVDSPGPKVPVTNNVWATLQRFALHALRIRETLDEMPRAEKTPVIAQVLEALQPPPVRQVGELISQTIDFEQSMERQRTAIKIGVDANLDELKRRYDGMADFLTEVNYKLRGDVPEWAQRYVLKCIFIPRLGFLTVVSMNPKTGKGNYEGEGIDDVWERMVASEGLVYCKNRRMKEMDEQCGDAYCMIIDREIEIIHDLAVRVLQHEDAILAASDVLGELDSILALAIGSRKYHWVSPVMTSDNVIHIEDGRHPLQELVVPAFISNDCHMSGGAGNRDDEEEFNDAGSSVIQGPEDFPSTLILTGPNHSGKSVYLKQVALIVYLAHIGCFVPAEKARIGITDRILTRIATRESVAKHESAFAIDLRQAAFAMNFATRRSLVLVDEFGKGTNSLDGAGLVTALLDHFASLGSERPKLIAATHFHEIFEANFLPESRELAFAHMDMRLDFHAEHMDDQVTYLFKLASGRSLSSFGSRCAAMNGVDEAVVERAESIMLLLARNEDLEAACSKLSDAESLKLEEAEAVARSFLEQDIESPRASGRSPKTGDFYRSILEQVLSMETSTLENT